MIEVKEFPNRSFETQSELFKELRENKKTLISMKRATDKRADSFCFYTTSNSAYKSETQKNDDPSNNEMLMMDNLAVKCVINTTNYLDSHGDVHINGIWNKSIADNNGKGFLHLQEHQREFDKIISDNATASIQAISWNQLGLPYDGNTEALVFDSLIQKKRNEFMLKQYANGWVKNHSVGMRYVKIELAINSEADYDADEKAVWDKYYPIIANKEVADERGYFWAVTEAKIIEGSAVVMGSNDATPTLPTNENKTIAVDENTIETDVPTIDVTHQIEQLKQIINKI